jgi:hypothetical protein
MRYACMTDGAGTLIGPTILATNIPQQVGIQSPDGSLYMTLTDGDGTILTP